MLPECLADTHQTTEIVSRKTTIRIFVLNLQIPYKFIMAILHYYRQIF